MESTLTTDDEGKDVIDSNGEQIGVIEHVTDRGAIVEPVPELPETVTLSLGWTSGDSMHVLREPSIDTITGEEVHLRSNL